MVKNVSVIIQAKAQLYSLNKTQLKNNYNSAKPKGENLLIGP